MNGYLLSPGRYLTADLQVRTDREAFTDIWGKEAHMRADLTDVPDTYMPVARGTFFAVVTTARGRVYYHATSGDAWEPPTGLPAADTMRTLDTLAATIKCRALQFTPGYRGISILAQTRERHPEWFTHDALPEKPTAEPVPNFTVKTHPTPTPAYLHVYDVRAAWLAAARTAPCGYGERRLLSTFTPKREGLWLCHTRPAVPAPITRPGWYPTALVRAQLDVGHECLIRTGWVWEHEATALRALSERLWLARSDALAAGRTPAERAWLVGAIKRIYTRTFGKLQKGEQRRTWATQPYWYLSLRAEAARRLWRVYHAHPHAIGLDTDSIFILSPEPDAAQAFALNTAGQPLANPQQFTPGRWHYEASYRVTSRLLAETGGSGAAFSRYLHDRCEPLNLWGQK